MSDTNLDRRYDEVCVVGTHNSYTGNTIPIAILTNQSMPIVDQLRRGVRFLQLDIYRRDDGSFYCQHSDYGPDVELSVCLGDIATFMAEDASAVVAIAIEPHLDMKDAGVVRALLSEYAQAGLWPMFFDPAGWTFDDFQRWPTLRQMIEKNWRLVVFSQNHVSRAEEDFRRLLYLYDYVVENVWGQESLTEPTWTDARAESRAISATNRGLFVMNHFNNVNPQLVNEVVNDSAYIARHIDEMRALYFRTPNFINVNFFEVGGGGGPSNASALYTPAFRLLENIDLAKRFQMTGNVFIEVKGRENDRTMVAQLMDDYKTVTIQPKSDHPGQLWVPIYIQGSATGIAFIHIDRNGRMYALSGQAKNADVTVVPFTPGSIPDSIIWKNLERTHSSDFKAIQYARNDSYNLNVRSRVKTGNKIATWEWSGGDDNERWRIVLA